MTEAATRSKPPRLAGAAWTPTTRTPIDPPMPPIPDAIPHDPRTGKLTADLPCIGCGYNLIHQSATGDCAECGRAIRDSLAAHRVWFRDEHFLQRMVEANMAFGIAYALIALLTLGSYIGFVACSGALFIPFWGFGAYALFKSWVPSTLGIDRSLQVAETSFLVFGLSIVCAFLSLMLLPELVGGLLLIVAAGALAVHWFSTMASLCFLSRLIEDQWIDRCWWIGLLQTVLAGLAMLAVLSDRVVGLGQEMVYTIAWFAIVTLLLVWATTCVLTAYHFHRQRRIARSLTGD